MNRRFEAFSWTASVLLVASFIGSAQAATLSKTVISDGMTIALADARVAEDSQGRIHVAARGVPTGSLDDESTREIYYLLLESDGDVLIDATQINTADATREGRVDIAVLSDDRAVITWYMSGEALRYSLVNPAADDRDGDAADPADPAFLIRREQVIGTATGRGHHQIGVDANDIVHVVAYKDGVYYLSFDPVAATVDNAETNVAAAQGRPHPAMALDSAGNVHFVISGNDLAGEGEAIYYMLDGTDGSVLIDATALYNATSLTPHATHFTLWVDSNDRVNIVYGDKRNTFDATTWCESCGQGGTMVFTRLDPSLDDQSGDAANIGAIRVGNEAEIGALWYAKAVPSSGRVNVIGTGGGRGGLLVHASVSSSGGDRKAPRVFDEQAGGFGWSRHYVSSVDNKVFWSESVFVPTLTGTTSRLIMTNVSSFTGGGGGGGSPGLPLLLAFGLAGLLRLRRG